jgi:hypothetical protein
MFMKKSLSLIFVFCSLPTMLLGQRGIYQHGSVVRMHMGDCVLAHHGFAVAFGPASSMPQEYCPEYTLLSENVVYVIVGKSSNQLIPLAESIDFRLHKNELAVRVDDAKRETKFTIKEMIVRSDWERIQRHLDQQMRASENQAAMNTRD